MVIKTKLLALLAAGAIGSSLAACHRGEQDKSASNQESSPMNQAPKQGYTGPASPSTTPPSSAPGAASSSSGDNSTGSTNPSSSQQQPGTSNQEQQPQQQK